MTIPVRLFSYIPNTLAQSSQVNSNENILYAWANGGIDDTNLNHLVGIYASTITANSAATSKFGTNPASTVGFQFIAPAANIVPLTVSGVTSQSADIFDITATSGGAKYLFVSANGFLGLGPVGGTGPGTTVVQIFNDAGTTNGLSLNVPTGSTNGYQFLVGGAAVAQITNNAHIFATGSQALVIASTLSALSAPATSGGGDLIAQRSISGGQTNFGGASSSGTIDWNINVAASFALKTGGGAFANFSAGTYTNASDATLKTNITPIADSLVKIKALTPVTFDWVGDGTPGIGFTAQDIQAQFPDAVSASEDGTLGYAPTAVLAHLVAAFQEYVTAHP